MTSTNFSKHKIQNSIYSRLPRLGGTWGFRIQSGGCGLFGDLFMALEALLFCERLGVVGIPDWGPKSLYFDSKRGENAWEYFFLRPGEATKSHPRILLPFWPSVGDFAPKAPRTAREVAGADLQRLVQVRPEIEALVDEFASDHFDGSEVIGVHIRGTDTREGTESRFHLGLEHFVNELQATQRRRPGSKVFLATDEQAVVEQFRKLLGGDLVVRECLRSTTGASIHGHHDGGVEGNPYQKGLDVILDALLLSRCDCLIRSHSRITCYSLCVNVTQEFVDLERRHHGLMRTPWLHQ